VRELDKSYLPTAIKLAQRGYVAATMSYRLSPRNQFPAAVEDAKAACAVPARMQRNTALTPTISGTMGGSAGGTLVLFLGLTADVPEFEGTGPNREFSSRVQCVVDDYGATDFTQSYQKSVDAAGSVLPMFLGGHLDSNRAIHQKASPLNWVTPNAAPVLAIHGTADPYVAYEQSLWLGERMICGGCVL
jgi:acetyl esterase/lipase